MDPNEALKNAREAAKDILSSVSPGHVGEWYRAGRAEQLAEAFEALDSWLSGAGFLPDAWKKAADSTKEADEFLHKCEADIAAYDREHGTKT